MTIALANTGPDAAPFRLPDGREGVLDGFASAWFALAAPGARPRPRRGHPADAARPVGPS